MCFARYSQILFGIKLVSAKSGKQDDKAPREIHSPPSFNLRDNTDGDFNEAVVELLKIERLGGLLNFYHRKAV